MVGTDGWAQAPTLCMGHEPPARATPNILALGFIQPRAPNNSHATIIAYSSCIFVSQNVFLCTTKQQNVSGWGFAPDHTGRVYDALPDP